MTLVEMLLAGTVSAITATAGATMIYAVSSASGQTHEVRSAKNKGRFALLRISKAIRSARAIGDVTSTAALLWREDINKDDVPNLYELGLISYAPATQELTFDSLTPPVGGIPGIVVPNAQFQDLPTAKSLMVASGNMDTVVWVDGVEAFGLSCFPSKAEARIVDVKFQIRPGKKLLTFSESITPRASADYLFVDQAVEVPVDVSKRKRRKHRSRWKGFYDLKGQIAPGFN